MRLFRIGSAGPTWGPDDLSGVGAARDPGRWNAAGQSVVYAAPTLALAVLETAAHIDDHGLPLHKYVVEVDVPDDVWAPRQVLTVADLPVGWDAIPHGLSSVQVGSRWHTAGLQAVLEVPSVIVPEESIVLINGAHPDRARITARATRRFEYNRLFRGAR